MKHKYFLVYQAGIANVFKVKAFNLADYGREAQRILQSDFQTCKAFCFGLAQAGAIVRTAHCNQAGDIIGSLWSEDLDNAPFSDKIVNINRN